MILVAILDKKALCFYNLYAERNEETAIRNFSLQCQNPEGNLHKFPEDYQLCKLANYDENQGKIIPEKVPTVLATAQSFITPQNEPMEVK